MKKLLTLIVLMPLFCNAQKWQVSAGGGASTISQPQGGNILKGSDARLNFAALVSVSYVVKPKIKAGIDISTASLSREYSANYVDAHGNRIYSQQQVIYMGSPAIFITPSVSFLWNGLYAGLQAGYVFGLAKDDVKTQQEHRWYYDRVSGYCVGVHLGYSVKISKRFSAFADCRANFVQTNIKNGPYTGTANFIQSQAVLGVAYRW